LLPVNRLVLGRLTRTAFSWIGLAVIGLSVIVVPSTHGFPAPWAALPILGASLVIVAGHGANQSVSNWLLTNRVSRYVGDISYSLYLWHYPVAILLIAEIPSGTPKYYSIAIGLSLALAALSYHLLENPVRQSVWMTSRSRTKTRTGIALTGTVALAAIVASLVSSDTVAKAPHRDLIIANGAVTPIDYCAGAQAFAPGHVCVIDAKSSFLTPSLDQQTTDTGIAYDCWMNDRAAFKTCSYGSRRADATKIALVGDSHAAMLLPALSALLVANDWRVDTYLGWGCVWMPAHWVRAYCTAMPDIQQHLLTGHYAMVLTSAARQKTGDSGSRKQDIVSQMVEAWTPVSATGAKVIAIDDNPTVSTSALECLSRVHLDVNHNDCTTSRDEATSVTDPLIRASKLVPGAKQVNMTSFFCTSSNCPTIIGHELVYRDEAGHITATFAESLGPYLIAAVKMAAAG
jgi:hypothetical protein